VRLTDQVISLIIFGHDNNVFSVDHLESQHGDFPSLYDQLLCDKRCRAPADGGAKKVAVHVFDSSVGTRRWVVQNHFVTFITFRPLIMLL
jgi:hypothetical protein